MSSRLGLLGLIVITGLSLATSCGISTPIGPTITQTWTIQLNTPYLATTFRPTETLTPTPKPTNTHTPSSTPDMVKQGLELPSVARVVDFGDGMVAFGDYSDIPVYECEIETGVWKEFEREIGRLNRSVPESMFAPISIEKNQYLRFTDGKGGLLPYGYIGFQHSSDWYELRFNPEWIGDRLDVMQEEHIILLFHGRLRGVITEQTTISGELKFVVLEIPIERIDQLTGEQVWTGDSQYVSFYMTIRAKPSVYEVKDKNINEFEPRRMSVYELVEQVQFLPVGASIVFGVPYNPMRYGIKSDLQSIYEGKLFETYGEGLAVSIYLDSSYFR